LETCFIIITNDCNNSCSYCINNNNKENIYSEYQNVAFDKYKKLIKELREIKFSDVVITGGEPLLYPEINRLIEEIHKNGLTSTLITNGEKLDDHSLDKLKKSGLNNLTLSLNNFANPGMLEINEIIKNYSKKIKLIEKYFNKICLNFILTAANYNYCNKIYDKFGKNINQFLMISPIAIEQNNKLYDKLSLTKLTEKNWKTLKEKLSD
jgi:MoaA/NifB/PqqE/SkfB family radical SAM enzyme